MVNNSSNIHKPINKLSPQIIDHQTQRHMVLEIQIITWNRQALVRLCVYARFVFNVLFYYFNINLTCWFIEIII
jgi:hypothetical protein